MSLTVNNRVAQEFGKRVDAAIETLKEDIGGGMMAEMDYRRQAGVLQGLRLAKDLIDQALTTVEKQL